MPHFAETLLGEIYLMRFNCSVKLPVLTVLTVLKNNVAEEQIFLIIQKNKAKFCSVFNFQKSLNSVMLIKVGLSKLSLN